MGRRFLDWAASIGKPRPPIEERFAKDYLATLSPDKAASLLSALALLDRVHGKAGDVNLFSAAFKKEGLEKLGALASNMRATIQVRLAKAAEDTVDPEREVDSAYELLLTQIEELLKSQEGRSADRKAQLILLHTMLDMMLEHKSVSEEDLKQWLLKLPAARKNELLEVENGKTSRVGRLLMEERQSQALKFAEAAEAVLTIQQQTPINAASASEFAKAVDAAGAELQKLVQLTGSKDGEAACKSVSDGFAKHLTSLNQQVRDLAEAGGNGLSILSPKEASQLLLGARRLGVAVDGTPFKELSARLMSERDDVVSMRDSTFGEMMVAVRNGNYELARTHIHAAARHFETARSIHDALGPGGLPIQSEQLQEAAVRQWAALEVDKIAKPAESGMTNVAQLLSGITSSKAPPFSDKWLEPGPAPANGAPNDLSPREKRTVELMIESVREQASANCSLHLID